MCLNDQTLWLTIGRVANNIIRRHLYEINCRFSEDVTKSLICETQIFILSIFILNNAFNKCTKLINYDILSR